MKRNKVTLGNAITPQGGHENIITRAKHFNDLMDDLDAINPSDGVLKGSTVSESTVGAGVVVDGLTIKDGHPGEVNSVIATVTGLGTGQLSANNQIAVIYSANAGYYVSLPLLATTPTGAEIRGVYNGTTGCKLRVHPSDISGTKYINNVTGGNKLKINGTTGCAYFEAVKRSSTKWIVKTWSQVGGSTTITPALT